MFCGQGSACLDHKNKVRLLSRVESLRVLIMPSPAWLPRVAGTACLVFFFWVDAYFKMDPEYVEFMKAKYEFAGLASKLKYYGKVNLFVLIEVLLLFLGGGLLLAGMPRVGVPVLMAVFGPVTLITHLDGLLLSTEFNKITFLQLTRSVAIFGGLLSLYAMACPLPDAEAPPAPPETEIGGASFLDSAGAAEEPGGGEGIRRRIRVG